MDIVTTSLEALIQRATCNQNQCRDTAAIDAFCGLVCKEPDCAQSATRFITAKIHSLHEWEALQALHVLDVCMKRCGSNFHAEVGKFRFLNELIKLVSPKYNGAHTPEPVKRRVLELMQSWTIYYPRELKIKEAYEMLKKQGVVKEETMRMVSEPHKSLDQDITPLPSRHQDSIFQDTEKSRLLQKLLQSKNPDDLTAANRLIKTMVKEDERRIEMKSRHLSELEAAHNNARLLSEMLTSYNRDTSSSQDLELITELHASCLRYQPNIQKLLSDVHNDERLFNEVLAANDELSEVLEKYSAVIVRGVSATSVGSNLLDLSTPSEETITLNTSVPLLNDSLITTGLDNSLPSSAEIGFVPPSFSQNHPILTQPLAPLSQPSTTLAQNFSTPLASFTPQSSSDLTSLGDIFGSPPTIPTPSFKSGTERTVVKTGLEELDALSESLLRQSLPQPVALNSGKVPMNQLPLSLHSSPAHSLLNPLPTSDPKCEDLLIDSTDDLVSEPTQINVDIPLDESPPLKASISKTVDKTETDIPVKNESLVVKPLGDITVPLDTIKPGNLSPLTVLEERGVSITIHFGRDSPRPDISVFVVTTTSKSQHPITDYLFQAIVPKCCRLRLQPPSSTELPAHNPFLPPAAITQVMLIASPNKEAISLRVVVSFTMDDETVTEMKELEQFPLLIS